LLISTKRISGSSGCAMQIHVLLTYLLAKRTNCQFSSVHFSRFVDAARLFHNAAASYIHLLSKLIQCIEDNPRSIRALYIGEDQREKHAYIDACIDEKSAPFTPANSSLVRLTLVAQNSCRCIHRTKQSPCQVTSPQGGADLRFLSPQPDTSLHCQTTWLVHRAVCLFTSCSFRWYSLRLPTQGWPG